MDMERIKVDERKCTVCACVSATLLGCLASSAFGIAIYAAQEVDNLEDEITRVPMAAIGERFTVNQLLGFEGVNWDVENERFIIGSVNTDKIYSFVPGQEDAEPLPDAAFNTTFGNVGVYLDQNSERNILWSASTGWTRGGSLNAPVQASIMRYDLSTEKLVEDDVTSLRLDPARYMLLNDVVADDEGTAYFSNSFDGQIIAAKFVDGRLQTKSITMRDFQSNIGLFGLNGMEYYDNALFVAFGQNDGSNAQPGIYRIPDPGDKRIYERDYIVLGVDVAKLNPGLPFVGCVVLYCVAFCSVVDFP
jgi:hypothetical protein